MKLASWGERFLAWFIDIIIINPVIWIFHFNIISFRTSFIDLSFKGLILLIYWTILEGYRGQSIGKMVMDIKVVTIKGKQPSYVEALIESFGKAYLLPIDLIFGWLFLEDKRQRVFNKVSNTIVIQDTKRRKERRNNRRKSKK